MKINTNEVISWKNCKKEDLWIFDKLILSKKLNYNCGPKGVDVNIPSEYIIRPCVNIMGMGEGAYFEKLENSTDHIKTGHFWCEKFEGRHLSVDYHKGKQILCVEGSKEETELQKWKKWTKVNDKIDFPEIIIDFKEKYHTINVEYIDGNIIEIHLRGNPDFQGHNSDFVIPVWNDDKIKTNQYDFIENKDGERLGFYIKKGSK